MCLISGLRRSTEFSMTDSATELNATSLEFNSLNKRYFFSKIKVVKLPALTPKAI